MGSRDNLGLLGRLVELCHRMCATETTVHLDFLLEGVVVGSLPQSGGKLGLLGHPREERDMCKSLWMVIHSKVCM